MEKKRLVFKKGIRKIIFPFLLTDFSPWQQQIAVEMEKVRSSLLPRKNIEWGYRIENGIAEITISKT